MSIAAGCAFPICRVFDMADFIPETAGEISEIVSHAAAQNEPLEILGRGSKRGIGRPAEAVHSLSTARLNGITLYEPEELVLSAKAGTPLAAIDEELSRHNQHLAFEPPHWGKQTIGGVIATGFSGPRRLLSGAVRDHLLGFTAVNGRGEIFKSGGRVVKNVTGYDLPKLMTGSFGTLAVLTEITLKVLPRPQSHTTLVLEGRPARESLVLLNKAVRLPFDISGAAWTNSFAGKSIAALRLEGFVNSVAERAQSLCRTFGFRMAGAEFDSFWNDVRDARIAETAHALWRIAVPPASATDIVELLPHAKCLADWAGGLIWIALEESGDCGAALLRGTIARTGGHATLIKASVETRSRLAVFQPQPEALAKLTLRIKESFDPLHILNRGRMYAGL